MLRMVSEILHAELSYQMSNEVDAPIGLPPSLVYRRDHEINRFKRPCKARAKNYFKGLEARVVKDLMFKLTVHNSTSTLFSGR